jgi:hypothetical protein
MDQSNSDPAVLEGVVGLRVVPQSGTIEPRSDVVTNEPDLGELLDYQPVPPRQGHSVLVRLRHGGRLKPLAYPLDEEDS